MTLTLFLLRQLALLSSNRVTAWEWPMLMAIEEVRGQEELHEMPLDIDPPYLLT